jgi:hypothetical protein
MDSRVRAEGLLRHLSLFTSVGTKPREKGAAFSLDQLPFCGESSGSKCYPPKKWAITPSFIVVQLHPCGKG